MFFIFLGNLRPEGPHSLALSLANALFFDFALVSPRLFYAATNLLFCGIGHRSCIVWHTLKGLYHKYTPPGEKYEELAKISFPDFDLTRLTGVKPPAKLTTRYSSKRDDSSVVFHFFQLFLTKCSCHTIYSKHLLYAYYFQRTN